MKSDCYYGVDAVVDLEIEVLPSTHVNKEIFVHPDDQKIEKQATWIQSVMTGMQGDDESSDEEIPELEDIDEGKEIEDIIDS